jgi:hypothetical protein
MASECNAADVTLRVPILHVVEVPPFDYSTINCNETSSSNKSLIVGRRCTGVTTLLLNIMKTTLMCSVAGAFVFGDSPATTLTTQQLDDSVGCSNVKHMGGLDNAGLAEVVAACVALNGSRSRWCRILVILDAACEEHNRNALRSLVLNRNHINNLTLIVTAPEPICIEPRLRIEFGYMYVLGSQSRITLRTVYETYFRDIDSPICESLDTFMLAYDVATRDFGALVSAPDNDSHCTSVYHTRVHDSDAFGDRQCRWGGVDIDTFLAAAVLPFNKNEACNIKAQRLWENVHPPHDDENRAALFDVIHAIATMRGGEFGAWLLHEIGQPCWQ